MNNNATLERLGQLKLFGMERNLQGLLDTNLLTGMTAPEALAQLVDAEYDERRERRASRLIRSANFRSHTSLAELDFSTGRSLDRASIARFVDCTWVGNADILTPESYFHI